MKNLLLLLLCWLGITTSHSQIFNDGRFQYTVTDATNNYVSVNKLNSICPTGGDWIPDTVEYQGQNYAVKSIEDSAFEGCDELIRMDLNIGLTHIGKSAFRNCTKITGIFMKENIISIGNYAFENCSSLMMNSLPPQITSLGTGTFRNCSSIRQMTISNNVTSIGDEAFYGCSSLININIPNNVLSIGNSAFEECTSLNSLLIPNGMTTIGESAFSNCTNLQSVEISKSVNSIGNYAFKQCNNLTSFRVRWDIPLAINANVFESVTLTNIPLTVPAAADQSYQTSPVWQDFQLFIKFFNNGVLEYTVTDISNNYVSVRKYHDAEPVDNLIIPETITNNTTTYTISNVEDSAFALWKDFNSVSLPNSLTSIGDSAFRGCSSLSNISIPNTIDRIEANTFRDCTALQSVFFLGDLKEIGRSAFINCLSLTDIILPESLTKIGSAAFQNCTSLVNISLSSKVTIIEEYTFSLCSGLTSFNVPKGILSIGENAFWRATGLKSFTVHWDTPLQIDADVFSKVDIENIPLYVPSGTVSAYQAAPVWKNFGSFEVLGISDFAITTVHLYPNPTSEFLKIELNGASQLKNARIFNNFGQLVSEEKKTQISVSNYSKGLYFAEIETNQGKVTKKFIVE